MAELFKNLGLEKIDEILILNEPEGFSAELDKLKNITIRESVIRTSEIDFALIFITQKFQIQNTIQTVYPKLVGDAVLWFAIPSNKYKTDLNILEGWGILGDYNLKQVDVKNINDDWIGIRFRKIEFLKQPVVNTQNSLH